MSALSNLEIARRSEARQRDATARLAAESELIAGGCVAFDGPASFLNRGVGFGMNGPVEARDLERLIAFFSARGVTPNARISSYADASMFTELKDRGFVLRDLTHAMARELAPTDDDPRLEARAVDGLRIEPLDKRDAEAVERYVHLVAGGFVADPKDIPESHVRASTKAAIGPTAHPVVAFDGDDLVGAASAATADGLGVLFGATVKASHRRRGIHTALLIARIHEARARGATLVVVDSSPNGTTERNAERLGFHLAFARLAFAKQPSP